MKAKLKAIFKKKGDKSKAKPDASKPTEAAPAAAAAATTAAAAEPAKTDAAPGGKSSRPSLENDDSHLPRLAI